MKTNLYKWQRKALSKITNKINQKFRKYCRQLSNDFRDKFGIKLSNIDNYVIKIDKTAINI